MKKRGALKAKRVQKAVTAAKEEEPTYDNNDYTGSHPEIRKQEGIRRKKPGSEEQERNLGQSET